MPERWTFKKAVKTGLRKTFVFAGTASRAEFWLFFLFTGICVTAFSFISEVFIITSMIASPDRYQAVMRIYQLALAVFTVFFAFLYIGPAVRRCHDTGRSGLFLLIPIYGFIVLFKETKQGNNPYAVDRDLNPGLTLLGKILFVIYVLGLFAFSVHAAFYGPIPQLPDFRNLEFPAYPQESDSSGNII